MAQGPETGLGLRWARLALAIVLVAGVSMIFGVLELWPPPIAVEPLTVVAWVVVGLLDLRAPRPEYSADRSGPSSASWASSASRCSPLQASLSSRSTGAGASHSFHHQTNDELDARALTTRLSPHLNG